MDSITTVLVGLYEEPDRPQNAIDYIKRYLGAPVGIDAEALKAENEKLKKEKADLESQLNSLKAGLFRNENIYNDGTLRSQSLNRLSSKINELRCCNLIDDVIQGKFYNYGVLDDT